MISHANADPIPVKWVYEKYSILRIDDEKHLYTVECPEEEVELWSPFDHKKYDMTRRAAAEKYGVFEPLLYLLWDEHYWNDPDYPIDWTDRSFG